MTAAACVAAVAQDSFDELSRLIDEEFSNFEKQIDKDFDDFTKQMDSELISFMKRPWKKAPKPKVTPRPNPPKPELDSVPIPLEPVAPPAPKPLPNPVVVPAPEPQPAPAPVTPPAPKPKTIPDFELTYYGTRLKIAGFDSPAISIEAGQSYQRIIDAYKTLSAVDCNNMLLSCLNARESLALPDWAYIDILNRVAGHYYGSGTQAAQLMTGMMLQRSGYSIRYAQDGQSYKLFTLVGSHDYIYGQPVFELDGVKYVALQDCSDRVYFCDFKYTGEKVARLIMDRMPKLAFSPSKVRTVQVVGHPDLTFSVTTNKNLIDFYNNYPDGQIGDESRQRWRVHADVPVSPELARDLYPRLKAVVARCANQYEQVNLLLKLVQSFPYALDDDIWGRDRAFFPDESWYYPYSDCEDHAIHMTRLARDILGLDAVLIYYPGHLSAAIAITDGSARGAYVEYSGKRYTITDGTYF